LAETATEPPYRQAVSSKVPAEIALASLMLRLDGMRTPPFGASEPRETDPQTYAIIGAAMEVHRVLGCGFLEAPYASALEIELQLRGIPISREVFFPLTYKGHALAERYRADFVCFESIVVEVKAMRVISDIEDAQLINYLRASGLWRGLLLNFGSKSLSYRRLVQGQKPKKSVESV
jgi:GxxExxY protein